MNIMKEKILELRKLGKSYNEIVNELGCSKSTVSFHCVRNNISNPVPRYKLINQKTIDNIFNDSETLTIKEISEKYKVSESSVKKYIKPKYKKKNKNICINCGKETTYRQNKQFCSSQCNSEYRHKMSYLDFIENNEKYCVGNYTPKSFKDFFLKEQNNKCDICGCEPQWMNKPLIFVLDHKDGDASNNKRENLRLICPNCDSQTDTFKSKTKNSKRRNYWKEKILRDNGGNLAG